MNIAKNMEAIFIVAVGLVGMTSIAQAAVPTQQVAKAAQMVQVRSDTNMQVVTVSAKRLTPAEKAAMAR